MVASAGGSKSQATWVAVLAPVRDPAPQPASTSKVEAATAVVKTLARKDICMRFLLGVWLGCRGPGSLYVCY